MMRGKRENRNGQMNKHEKKREKEKNDEEKEEEKLVRILPRDLRPKKKLTLQNTFLLFFFFCSFWEGERGR